jgi:hypothetical protein
MFRAVLIGLMAIDLAACAAVAPRIPYTPSEAAVADVPGFGNIRFYGDAPGFVFDRFRAPVFAAAAARHEPVSFLALSSGGSDGAYGAGFLKGLSEQHRRPQFTIVSGVSTGALMAPFVFLGPAYDGTLEDLYTSGYAASLVKTVNVLNGLFGNALVDNDRLGHLIARYIDENILAAVAAEYRKGRRLIVVTTNLDAQRSVIWDMGAIAASGAPQALRLFRQVIAASASIPGLFPPRLVNVEAGGRQFQEMHVDGATIRTIYVAPDDMIFGGGTAPHGQEIKDLYVLVNNKIEPSFALVEDNAVTLAARAFSTVLKREGRADMLAAYAHAVRHGIGFHLAFLDAAAPEVPASDATAEFSTAYMQSLFARGEAQGRAPSPWSARPPLAQDPAQHDLNAAG